MNRYPTQAYCIDAKVHIGDGDLAVLGKDRH